MRGDIQVLIWGGIGNGWIWRQFKMSKASSTCWSRCDIDTCGLSLRLITYSRTAPCKCRYSSFLMKLCMMNVVICTHENIMKVVGMFDLSMQDEMRWDSFGGHNQGNQSRNSFVHQTVIWVEKAVLAEKSARKELSLIPLEWYIICYGLKSLREFFQKEDTDGFLLRITLDKDKLWRLEVKLPY